MPDPRLLAAFRGRFGLRALALVGLGLLAAAPTRADDSFEKKLVAMLQKTDKSIKLLRQQITESQSAPFLPDLYVQLAELNSEKSNTLYYLQKERQKDLDTLPAQDKAFGPVIEAQQEAIKTYQMVLKDFPQYDKRKETIFRLALALKSIDESTGFVKTASQLFHEYPNTEETSSVRLILGQQLFDQHEYARAREVLQPVVSRPFVYERNVAKYRVGLAWLSEGKASIALQLFEQVIRDPDLKVQENPYQVGLKNRNQGKTDLKREALIDSIRAYTQVYEKNPDPVPYYSHLAPTELLFQEVMEKLAMRYINLKKYQVAVSLLRTVGERTVEPQKVIAIYRQVLLSIPPEKRPDFPVSEMQFLLEKYTLWSNDYQMSPKTKLAAAGFFEKQVRDLATTNHQLAKNARDAARRALFDTRARDYYLLYLAFFKKSKHGGEMATDLADVYFAEGNFLKSGEYYLRNFDGEFGPVKDRRALIENAILCLQKKGKYSFYDTLRMRGLLIASIQSYIDSDKKKKSDPALNFLLAKSRYDQGFFPDSLDGLYNFISNFRRSRQVVDASELILDYFNTKSDYGGMKVWSEKLLDLKIPNQALNQKLARVRKQAGSKEIHEKIRSLAGYDDFAQGKSYLNLAMTADDADAKNLLLQEALAKSQREGDIQSFLQAATIMADKEKSPEKKNEILTSVAQESLKVSEYYQAMADYRKIFQSGQFQERQRVAALEKYTQVGLALRDWSSLRQAFSSPLFDGISAQTKSRMREQLTDYIDSPNAVSSDLVSVLLKSGITDDALLALYKAQYKLAPGARTYVMREVQKRCSDGSRATVCSWASLNGLDDRKSLFLRSLASAPQTLEGIQATAGRFMDTVNQYHSLEGSSDPFLETILSLRSYELYTAFARYLQNAGDANRSLKPVLQQKANETLATAKQSLNHCRMVNEKSSVLHPAIKDCASGKSPPLAELLRTNLIRPVDGPGSDPHSPKLDNLRRAVFTSKGGNEEAALKLARTYLDERDYFHAAAAAAYGMGLYKNSERDFRTVLGCAVMNLGYYSEANYHLDNGESDDGLKEKCLARIDEYRKH
jgi:tetratricopeptide (TPR) repeat protein